MNTVIVAWLILYQTPPSHKEKVCMVSGETSVGCAELAVSILYNPMK